MIRHRQLPVIAATIFLASSVPGSAQPTDPDDKPAVARPTPQTAAQLDGAKKTQNRFPPIGRRELLRRTLPPADPVIATVRGAQLHFAPGQPAGLHRSTVTTVGVVLSGSFRFRPEGERERVLHVGDQFIEGAGQTIVEFDNASEREPAEIACFYLADTVDHVPAEFLKGGLDAQLGRTRGAATGERQAPHD